MGLGSWIALVAAALALAVCGFADNTAGIFRTTMIQTEVPDEVLGWAHIHNEALHYCYVKSTYRRMGIGRGLVEGRAKFYTQYTDSHGRQFARAVGLQFNPFL